MKKSTILAALAAIGFSGGVSAAPEVPLKGLPFYWGVSYAWTEFEPDVVLPEDASGVTVDGARTGGILGRFGYQFHQMVSAEARYMHGIRDDNLTISGAAGSVELPLELDSMYGIYGKLNLLTDINFSPYVMIGYTQGSATLGLDEVEALAGTGLDEKVEIDEGDFSYGIGVDLCQDQPVCLNVEYMSYLSKDEFDANSFSVGLRFRF